VKPDVNPARLAGAEHAVARRKPSEGIGRLAASLASSDAAAPRIENRLVRLTVTTRWVTILAGIIFGFLRDQNDHFALASIALVVFAGIQTIYQLQPNSSPRLRVLVIFELALTVAACAATGGLASPFVLTPVTGFLLAGYVWGRRALVGTIVSGVMAVLATLAMQIIDASDTGAAGQIAVVFLLCGALGAFTRNLITDIERHREAALDQAADLATANELLVSLHGLAQTLPASFDLREVVDSTRTRLRSLFRFSALVVLVRDDAQSVWTVELAEGVRLPSYMGDHDLPQPLQRALTSNHPVIIEDRLVHPEPDEGGFAALARSGLYTALRARGALVGLIALEDVVPDAYGGEQRDMIESLSGLLALSIDNARWFARLRTLGAEAERARIARELHDRVAQSLAYVAFELERMHNLPGDRDNEIVELHDVVRGIVRELRETIYQLRSNVSEDEDIVMVAGRYLERFSERTGIAATWLPSASQALPYRIEQELWRIAQEALVNVERHADAKEVVVRWDVHNGVARLEVADDGNGFELAGVVGDHYGLVGMRERADAIGAHLAIESGPGRGTKVAVEVTLKQQDPERRSV
jgi:signal transduction histidine kinase